MARLWAYLQRKLGVDRLGRELGATKKMLVTYREQEARQLAAFEARMKSLSASSPDPASAASANRKAEEAAEKKIMALLTEFGAHLKENSRTAEKARAVSKSNGRVLDELVTEMRLILQAPSVAIAKSASWADPPILRDYLAHANIREIYPTDLFPGLEQVTIPVGSINEETGHANHVDLLYVSAIAKLLKAKRIFEFGTYQGRTTYHLAGASRDTHVCTLNLPPDADPQIAECLGIMFRGSDREKKITQIFADSREFDPEPYAGKMDFIFVDANHEYEFTQNDTAKAFAMLKPGGIIVWHDFAAKSPGVVRYLTELSMERPLFRLRDTCLVLYLDGVDVMAYAPPPRRVSALTLYGAKRDAKLTAA